MIEREAGFAAIKIFGLLLALMVVTGPSILLFFSLFVHGLTGSAADSLIFNVFIYVLWCVVLIWRGVYRGPFSFWHVFAAFVATCAVPYVYGPVARWVGPWLPSLASMPSIKEDTLSMWIMLTWMPWLLIQFVAFVGFGMWGLSKTEAS